VKSIPALDPDRDLITIITHILIFSRSQSLEDNWKPEFDLRTAVARCSGWFQTQEAAQACVDSSVSVTDDCDPGVSFTSSVISQCGDSSVVLTATDRCGNVETATVPVKIDEDEPNEVMCHFGTDTSIKDIDIIEQAGGTWRQTDFQYSASDACGEDLKVEVKVYSHEEYAYRAKNMAILYLDGNEDDKVSLQLSSDVCNKNLNSESNPHNDFGQCIKDPKIDDRVRQYKIIVTATDPAGNSETDTCTAMVVPRALKNKVSVPGNLQQFLLTEHSSIIPAPAPVP
jgi:hypothetical protein